MAQKKKNNSKKRPFMKKNTHEHIAWQNNQVICGIDEVGRGCLAGPLVTAAVILPPNTSYKLLKDSKEMSIEERQKAYKWIIKHCQYGYGIVHHRLVDKHNVWHATMIAMRRALMNLLAIAPQRPKTIVVDAMPLEMHAQSYTDIPIAHFPFGEKKSTSIAAASIIAKIKRDQMMQHMDTYFPHYIWYTNKGYGTKRHKQAIAEHQAVILHRKTYLKNLALSTQMDNDKNEQQTLFQLPAQDLL